jgi:hypothetical protein
MVVNLGNSILNERMGRYIYEIRKFIKTISLLPLIHREVEGEHPYPLAPSPIMGEGEKPPKILSFPALGSGDKRVGDKGCPPLNPVKG